MLDSFWVALRVELDTESLDISVECWNLTYTGGGQIRKYRKGGKNGDVVCGVLQQRSVPTAYLTWPLQDVVLFIPLIGIV